MNNKSYVSWGDFLDVYHKTRQKGLYWLFSKFKVKSSSRTKSKWDFYDSTSDFWLIPEMQEHWNTIISGDKHIQYEDYVAQKYLNGKSNLKMLSIGCGAGSHERRFAKYNCFSSIEAVDVSPESISSAKKIAEDEDLDIKYHLGDFKKIDFLKESYDLILFSSSLHHFDSVFSTLQDYVKPLLSKEGILVVFEYVGPNRLQWTKKQLFKSNELLANLPKKYKLLYDYKTVKRKVYRPGILRMLLVDPSEAPDSENIVSSLNSIFKVLEQKDLGTNICHLLLKGIAHNFVNNEPQTKKLISFLITEETKFVKENLSSDEIFGIYRK